MRSSVLIFAGYAGCCAQGAEWHQQCSSHIKAALREAVIAKKRFAHVRHNTKYPFIIISLGRMNNTSSIRRRAIYRAVRTLWMLGELGLTYDHKI